MAKLNFLNTIPGLENNVPGYESQLADQDIAMDIAGLESMSNLAADLMDGMLEDDMTSMNFNKVALVDVLASAGTENVDVTKLLTELEYAEEDGFGIESLKEAGQRTWYRIKAIAKAFISAVIAFFKKLVSLGGPTDKVFKKLKTKAEAFEKKYNEGIGKVKFDNAKKYKSNAKTLNTILGSDVTKTIVNLATNPSHTLGALFDKDLDGYIKIVKNPKEALGEMLRDKNKDSESTAKAMAKLKKDLNDAFVKAIKAEDLSYSEFRSNVKGALDHVVSIATDLEATEIFKKCADALKSAQQAAKDLNKLTAEEVQSKLGNANIQTVSETISGAIVELNTFPQAYAIQTKALVMCADKVFTEVTHILAA